MTARPGPLVRSSRATSVTRCPFCHESLDSTSEDWVACESCGALEHRACWRESRGCACCGRTQAVAPRVRPTSRRVVVGAWVVAGAALAAVALDLPARILGARAPEPVQVESPGAIRHRVAASGPEADSGDAHARAEAERARAREAAADEERQRRLEAEHEADVARQRRVFEIDPAEAVSYWHTSRGGGVATDDENADAAAALSLAHEAEHVPADALVKIAQLRVERAQAQVERIRAGVNGVEHPTPEQIERLAAAEAALEVRRRELAAARAAADATDPPDVGGQGPGNGATPR